MQAYYVLALFLCRLAWGP